MVPRRISTLAFAAGLFVMLQTFSETSAKPYTDIRKLPSITTDTLYPKVVEDSETSESMNLVRTMMQGSQLFQQIVRPRTEATYVTLFRLPWRMARSVSSTGYGMARGFMDAFADQFMETYKNMQKNVIPQAAESFATWNSPPKPNLQSAWLEGGV